MQRNKSPEKQSPSSFALALQVPSLGSCDPSVFMQHTCSGALHVSEVPQGIPLRAGVASVWPSGADASGGRRASGDRPLSLADCPILLSSTVARHPAIRTNPARKQAEAVRGRESTQLV